MLAYQHKDEDSRCINTVHVCQVEDESMGVLAMRRFGRMVLVVTIEFNSPQTL